MNQIGCQSNIAPIRRLLIKHPRDAHKNQATINAQWQALHYPRATAFEAAMDEYEAFLALLRQFEMEIQFLPEDETTSLDAIYTHDPVLMTKRGAILCNMGKAERVPEPEAIGRFLQTLDIPILGRIEGNGRLEGGDLIWLDERTVAVGEGYRTNAEGIRQLKAILGDLVDEIIVVPLPHWTGPDDCLHLMSFISPIDDDLAVVYSRLMSVPFRERLLARGIQLVEVPDEEYDTLACNILPVAPRQCLMVAGNPITQARLEAAGATVHIFSGEEICINGAGGPTCLTRPLLRSEAFGQA